MNNKLQTNIFEDVDKVVDYEYNHLTLAALLNSGVMDGMNPQELLDDIVGEWCKLRANYYLVNHEDRNGMIETIDSLENTEEV